MSVQGVKRRRKEHVTKVCAREGCVNQFTLIPWKAKTVRFCSKSCAGKVNNAEKVPKSWNNMANRYRRENDVGNVCRICGEVEFSRSSKRHHMDHDHETGQFRGLLCSNCNTKLGWYERFREEIDRYLAVYSS